MRTRAVVALSLPFLLAACSSGVEQTVPDWTQYVAASPAVDVSGWGNAPAVLRSLTSEEAVNAKCQEILGQDPAPVARALGYVPGEGVVEGYSWPKYPRNDFVAIGCSVPIEPSGDWIAVPIAFIWSADPPSPPRTGAVDDDPLNPFVVPVSCVEASIVQHFVRNDYKATTIEVLQRAGEALCT